MKTTPELEQALVAAFLAHVPYNVYFKDKEARFIAASAALVRYHGLKDVADILGKTDFELFASGHAGAAFADDQRIMRTGEPVLGKLEREDWADGRITWVVTSKLPLRDACGQVVGTFGISKDVTGERENQTRLEEARRDLADACRLAGMAEVATGVLHNVGNVLSSLNVSAALIAGHLRQSKASALGRVSELLAGHDDRLAAFLASDPKGRLVPEFLTSLARNLIEEKQAIRRELDSLRVHLDHIKDIVATQQAYATTAGVVEPMAAAALMDDAVRMTGGALDRPSIALVREFQPVPPICAERGRVLQILINLIRNAKLAVEDPAVREKRVVLAIGLAESGRVRLEVRDTGVGIAAENLTRIFGHGFTTRKGGHGFGLHSSALAAGEMGGSLIAQSEGPGRGARFILELPIAAATAAAQAA